MLSECNCAVLAKVLDLRDRKQAWADTGKRVTPGGVVVGPENRPGYIHRVITLAQVVRDEIEAMRRHRTFNEVDVARNGGAGGRQPATRDGVE